MSTAPRNPSTSAADAARGGPGAVRSRFAPSTTGPAHPGTLLAALLCWLDARSRAAHLILRLEDLDPKRSSAEWHARLLDDLDWFGVDFDEVQTQSELRANHVAALDALEAEGLLYPCLCSRSQVRAGGRPAPDGGIAYENTCRPRSLAGGWRANTAPLRVRLPDRVFAIGDESGLDLSQNPAREQGDPIVRRRDGAVAYNLAVVTDDWDSRITRVVRGRDIAPSTATQVALQQLLGYPRPVYRHHLLLLESRAHKLAKFHGAVGAPELRKHYSAPALCGVIAHAAGLIQRPDEVTPRQLLESFSWSLVGTRDRIMEWDGRRLALAAEG